MALLSFLIKNPFMKELKKLSHNVVILSYPYNTTNHIICPGKMTELYYIDTIKENEILVNGKETLPQVVPFLKTVLRYYNITDAHP